MKTDDLVTYQTPGGLTIEAIIRRVHKDGTATVEARFRLKPDGTRAPGYLNFKSRIPVDGLALLSAARSASEAPSAAAVTSI